jgi:SpoVK/Ycf46/Vps4 family AAA+-type ATPase
MEPAHIIGYGIPILIMTTSSRHRKVPTKKSTVTARKPKPRKAATSISIELPENASAKAKASVARPILLTGQSREELRTFGVALAAELDRDLYCVDLSRLAGKYIGETEKNLARVFAVAEATDAVLFFDEADALFGRHTEVSASHDRYANQETSYFLKQIEAYPGVVVLATRRRENLDEAFLRRLRFTSASTTSS